MNAPQDDEFNSIINGLNAPTAVDPYPYGPPAHTPKAGLTKRGKVAISVGAAVIAGSSLIGYQMYEANAIKERELELKAQALELEKLRETNRVTQTSQQQANAQIKERQASVDACVKGQADQVGKAYGSPSYRDIVDACQAQYTGTADAISGLENAASTQSADGGGGVNSGAVMGVLVLGGGLALLARKGKRPNAA
ncbi:hypothetical protein ACWGH4_00410 [Streptomyces sp. NPDC054847]